MGKRRASASSSPRPLLLLLSLLLLAAAAASGQQQDERVLTPCPAAPEQGGETEDRDPCRAPGVGVGQGYLAKSILKEVLKGATSLPTRTLSRTHSRNTKERNKKVASLLTAAPLALHSSHCCWPVTDARTGLALCGRHAVAPRARVCVCGE